MTAERVDALCAAFRGASLDAPFGPDTPVWKVGDKMFLAYAKDGPGVSVKCRDAQTASVLLALGKATQADYLRDSDWVTLPWSTPWDELEERVTTSYQIVRASLRVSQRLSM